MIDEMQEELNVKTRQLEELEKVSRELKAAYQEALIKISELEQK